MISINSYAVTENFVYSGVSEGVGELLKDVSNFSKVDVVVKTITESVMNQLCAVFDFGDTPVRFTPDLIRKMMNSLQEEQGSKPEEIKT